MHTWGPWGLWGPRTVVDVTLFEIVLEHRDVGGPETYSVITVSSQCHHSVITYMFMYNCVVCTVAVCSQIEILTNMNNTRPCHLTTMTRYSLCCCNYDHAKLSLRFFL